MQGSVHAISRERSYTDEHMVCDHLHRVSTAGLPRRLPCLSPYGCTWRHEPCHPRTTPQLQARHNAVLPEQLVLHMQARAMSP